MQIWLKKKLVMLFFLATIFAFGQTVMAAVPSITFHHNIYVRKHEQNRISSSDAQQENH
jgi:hypothetical protein